MKRLRASGLVMALLASSAQAAVPSRVDYFQSAHQGPQGASQSVDLALFEQFQRAVKEQRQYTAQDFFPATLQATDSSSQVMSKIAGHSLQTLLRSEVLKNSSLRAAAETLGRTELKAVVEPSDDDGIQHEVTFAMRAAQAQASVRYRGVVSSEIAYRFDSGTTTFEVNRDLGRHTQVVYLHSRSSADNRDTVSLRWAF